jgi:hypothetical protein
MLPKISLDDGRHKMIVAEAGERVLTPEQNEEYEKQHPNARRQPMRAEVSGMRMPMYQDGGYVSGVPAAPDISNLTTSRDSSGPNMNVTPSGPSLWDKVKSNAKKPGQTLPGQTMVDIHDTPQMDQEAFDKGGDVMPVYDGSGIVPADSEDDKLKAASVADQVKARATEIYKQAKEAQANYGSEAEGFKQKQENINQYKAATAEGVPAAPARMRSYAPVEADKLNPNARYGMRSMEKRLDPQGNVINPTTPQGMGAEGPQRPVPAGMRSFDCGGMVYDKGGDVMPVYDGSGIVPADSEDDKLKAAALEQATAEVTGAPADFSGPVIPNPKGIKVSDDTERPMAEPQKAQMSTGNAPLTRPTMNTQNASPQGPITSETSTGKANPMVSPASTRMPSIETPLKSGATDHPNASQEGSELPVSSEERVDKVKVATPKMISPEMQAVHQDADDAMKSGDTVKLGMAALNARMLKQGGAPEQVAPKAPTARENVVNQEKELHYKMLNAPTEEGRFQAEKELAELKRRTPLGSEGSSHPGMGGKIAHAFSSIGQGLARGVVPYALPYIPGSQANLAASEARGEQGVEESQKKQGTAVETGLKEAQTQRQAEVPIPQQLAAAQAERRAATTPAEIEAADAKVADATAVLQSGKVQIKEAGMSQQYLDASTELANAKTPAAQQAAREKMERIKSAAELSTKPTAATAEADKLSYESTIGKLNHAGLSTKPEDIPASLAAALKSGNISQVESDQAAGFREGNPPASTKIEISNAETANKATAKKASEYFTYSDAEGTHLVTGDKLPDGVESTPIKDSAAFIREAEASNIVQESLNKVAQDVHEHPEVFDNAAARSILATTLEQIDRQAMGLLVAGTGGQIPLPSGMGDMINTALQNKALDKKTGEALRNYIADYKSMKDKAIVQQMAMQQGKIGRSSNTALQAIINQIPNGSTPDSKTAQRQLNNLQQTQDDLMRAYPNKYGSYEKANPYIARGADGTPVNAQVPVYAADGTTVIGHGVNGKFVALPKK